MRKHLGFFYFFTILYRYSLQRGYDIYSRAYIESFPDFDSLSKYAQTPISWAVAEKLLSGVASNAVAYLQPKGYATRAHFPPS